MKVRIRKTQRDKDINRNKENRQPSELQQEKQQKRKKEEKEKEDQRKLTTLSKTSKYSTKMCYMLSRKKKKLEYQSIEYIEMMAPKIAKEY